MLPGIAPISAPVKQPPALVQKVLFQPSARATTIPLTWAATLAGSLIVIAVMNENNGAAPSTPAGYTAWPSGNFALTGPFLTLFYKIATAGETGVTITQGNNEVAAMMWEFKNASTIDFGTPVAAVTASPDPPAVTPAGGSKTYIAVAGAGHKVTTTTYSSGYSNGQTAASTGANPVRVAGAEKTFTGTTENPGTLALSASNNTGAFTFAVS
jgi:hypothetical protein